MKNILTLIFAFAMPAVALCTGVDKNTLTGSRTITKTFVVNADAQFHLSSHEADVNIITWDEPKVDVRVTLTVEAFDQEELDKMLKEFEVSMIGSAENVTVKSGLHIKTKVTTGNRTRIKTETQTIKIKSYSFRYDIKMPATNHLNLKNHYGAVVLGSHTGSLNLELYECKLEAGKVSAPEGVLNLRYTKANLGKIENADLKAYESKISLGPCKTLSLDAKYSKFTGLETQDVQLSAYESKIELGKINRAKGGMNYGALKIASARELELKTYELEMTFGDVDELTLTDTKYSKLTCGVVGQLTIVSAYENTMTFARVNTADVEAKYCQLDFGKIKESLELRGYELTCRIEEVATDFKKLSVDGKYTKVSLNLENSSSFKLKADMQYGNVDFPRENLEGLKIDKNGPHLTLSGKTKGYNGTSEIRLKGYETDVTMAYK